MRVRRRSLLRGGLGMGAAAGLGGLGGCAYFPSDPPAQAELPASAKAEIDGDLVYFNWADYLAPSVIKGFQKEYGVQVVESNFDSMEGMYAKIAAGNRYDIVFPVAKWVQKLRAEGRVRRIDHTRLSNAAQVYYDGSYYNDPWYDPESAVSVPFTVYKTGIAWRTDKVDSMTGSWADLWNAQASERIFTLDDQDEAIAMAALRLGYDVNTSEPDELDDINNMARGDAWIHHMWSGDFVYLRQGLVEDPENYAFEAPREGTPINSDAYCIPTDAQHPGTAMVFIDYLLRPEVAEKNMGYLYYPFPVRDALPAFAKLVEDIPACDVDLAELENPAVFRLLDAEEVQRRAATWTEVKAS